MLRALLILGVACALAAPARAIQPGATGSLRVQNGAADVLKVDGGDSGAGTTAAANTSKVLPRRADDCTAQTDGSFGELCIDDYAGIFMCVPSTGACDTVAEWKRLTGALRTGTTVPATCAVGDPLFFDTDAAAGARVHLCLATNTWVALDNPFGSQINASEMENTLSFSSAQVLDLATNDADLRLAQTASDGTNEGSFYLDSTSNEPEWYSGSALNKLENYAKLTGRASNQTLIGKATSDGSDDGALILTGSGSYPDTRGASLTLYGNENSGNGSAVFIMGDDASGGAFAVYTHNANAGVIGAADFAVEYDGNVCLQEPALSWSGCSKDLGIGGTTARTIGMENHTTGSSAGNSLTINAGGAGGTGTNTNGGDLVLASGRATGNGTSKIDFQTVDANQGTGTTARNAAARLRLRDGHIVAMGTAPSVSSCGTTPGSVTGNDTAGYVTTGTGTVNSCVVTFAKAFTTNAPVCTLVFTGSANGIRPTSVSTSGFTATFSASSPSLQFAWTCIGIE